MAEMLLLNPAKKKRRKKAKPKRAKTRRKVSSVAKRKSRTRRYRKNPARRKSGIGGILGTTIVPSAIAAGGAIALDMVMPLLPIPENMKEGPVKHLVKGAGAIGLGMLAGMFLKPKTAELITTGALTVIMHGAGKQMVQNFAPNIQMDGYDDYDVMDELGYVSPGMPVGEYLNEYVSDDGMGAYVDGISLDEELEL